MDEQNKREIDELMIEVSSSIIQITKPSEEEPKQSIDVNLSNEEFWGRKSSKLLDDYKFGTSLALFGKNELNTQSFFKRFSTAICATISNECQKRGNSAENLKPHYSILESCLLLLSKEIDKKDLKDQDIFSIIATLQGFISNYNNKKEK